MMKRLLMVLSILAVVNVSIAQDSEKSSGVDFYGVDFTAVNVVGAQEVSGKFIDAFEGINKLLVLEQAKYDVGKYLSCKVISIDYDCAVSELRKLDNVKFMDKKSPEIDLKSIVANYPTGESSCLLIVAKELNKPRGTGTFIAVVYDGVTRDIISEKEFTGKAGGFGLRNFWAGALYDGLKKSKYAAYR